MEQPHGLGQAFSVVRSSITVTLPESRALILHPSAFFFFVRCGAFMAQSLLNSSAFRIFFPY